MVRLGLLSVVAQRHRVFGQCNHLGEVEGELSDTRHHLCDQAAKIVGVLEVDSLGPEERLEPLFHSLLGVLCRRSRR